MIDYGQLEWYEVNQKKGRALDKQRMLHEKFLSSRCRQGSSPQWLKGNCIGNQWGQVFFFGFWTNGYVAFLP